MTPEAQVDRLKKVRNFLFEIIKDVPFDKLNTIPPGFNNNIIWHLGHLIAAQQGICFLRAGVPAKVSTEHIDLYKSGTKPEQPVTEEQAEAIKKLFFSSLDQLESDLNSSLFDNYNTWTTRYGVVIASISDAMEFVLYHEGLHCGYISYMKRLV